MDVPITSDLGGYQAFWRPVVLGAALWALAMLGLVGSIAWKVWRG